MRRVGVDAADEGSLYSRAILSQRDAYDMTPNNRHKPHVLAALSLAAMVLAASIFGCGSTPTPPAPESTEYQEAISLFYVGLAALDTGDDVRAEDTLNRLTERVPAEPAGWANYGVLALRHRDFDLAFARFEKARAGAPEDGRIFALVGLTESARGRAAEAVAAFRRSVELDAKNVKARYALAGELERRGDPENEAEAARVYQELLGVQPNNLDVLLEIARLSAKRGDADALQTAVARLAERAPAWPPEAQPQFAALQAAAAGPDPRAAGVRVAFLKNVLVRTPEYRKSIDAVKDPTGAVGDPIPEPLWLPIPPNQTAPVDEAMRFAPAPQEGASGWAWVGAVALSGAAAPSLVAANAATVRLGAKTSLAFPGGGTAPGPSGVLAADLDNDFNIDFVLAGAGGVRFFHQDGPDRFTDATPKTGLSTETTGRAYLGAWGVDYESDGDLDVVLAPLASAPVVLRNNGDGTFAEQQPFSGTGPVRGFAWGDFDGDGDGDPAFVGADGVLRVFANERLGVFVDARPPAESVLAVAIGVGDANVDGVLDLIVVHENGAIRSYTIQDDGAWATAPLAAMQIAPDPATAVVLAADFDNNGAFDLVVASAAGRGLWLGGGEKGYQPLDALPVERVMAASDLDGDGLVDLACLAADGALVVAKNTSTKNYNWVELSPRARQATGDQRMNSFGIGGEVEIRAGLLARKSPIAAPSTHFGIGKNATVDLARVTWPNGAMQAEFTISPDKPVVFDQRLEGSCPWLFAWNGERMAFVTDFIWRSPLGLRINAQDTGRVAQTEDWVRIRGDQLAARDGFYDVRITAELWETHFFDHVSLMVVDHPAGTEALVDERFAIPPPTLAVRSTGPLHPVASAVDDAGQDVSAVVRDLDAAYLDTFGRGRYQGVTRDHWVEVDLSDAPDTANLVLVASGWIHPTDSSINVAIGQGTTPAPQGLTLETPDVDGVWSTAKPGLGFPAGKTKTVVLALGGAFKPGAPRRVRLRTNLEIYWDRLAWAELLPDAAPRVVRLDPTTADLRYRGFSWVGQANASSPELPEYDRLAATSARWADLVGYYTRFGDVRELLTTVDDRYVIMNAGDELVFRFAEQPPPPDGWTRDYVLIGDGWVKDGNFNTTHSKTVAPLPLHDRPDYDAPVVGLEDDPAYRRHPEDWQTYHTRYVTPRAAKRAIWPQEQR